MLTCFISIDNLESTYQKVLLWIFLIIPLFSFAFGGIQVYLIMKSPEYKIMKIIEIFLLNIHILL